MYDSRRCLVRSVTYSSSSRVESNFAVTCDVDLRSQIFEFLHQMFRTDMLRNEAPGAGFFRIYIYINCLLWKRLTTLDLFEGLQLAGVRGEDA